jgi:hypothetical protein
VADKTDITTNKTDTTELKTDSADTNSINSTDNSVNGTSNVSDSQESASESSEPTDIYTPELREAYNFSYNNSVTKADTIEKAKVFDGLTRIQMANMLSNYAINVLKKVPDSSRNIKFRDVSSKLDKKYDGAVTKAYQLGIM